MGMITSAYSYKNVDTQENIQPNIESEPKKSRALGLSRIVKRNEEIFDGESNYNSMMIIPKKKVSFANQLEKRTFILEDNLEIRNFNYKNEKVDLIDDEEIYEDDEDFRELSFELAENSFILEDGFYKHHYNLPKKPQDVKWIQELTNEEFNFIIKSIEDAIQLAKNLTKSFPFHRIDGILLKKSNMKLIILTEFYLFDFNFDESQFELMRLIEIAHIDFITLTRSGNFMILHLVPLFKNEENVNQNYFLNLSKLEKVVANLASSCFFDKPVGSTNKLESINRKINIITLNDNFEVIDMLGGISEFGRYRQILMEFLSIKFIEFLGELYNNNNFEEKDVTYKYASIKYREIKENKIENTSDINNNQSLINKSDSLSQGFTNCDLFIISNNIFFLRYNHNNRKFEFIFNIPMHTLLKLSINREIRNSFILYDTELYKNGLEVISESYNSIMGLIDEIYLGHLRK